MGLIGRGLSRAQPDRRRAILEQVEVQLALSLKLLDSVDVDTPAIHVQHGLDLLRGILRG